MSKLGLFLPLVALSVLAACSRERVTPAPAPIVITPPPTVVTAPPAAAVPPVVVAPQAPAPLRAGFGRIESITLLPSPSASAGATAEAMRRLTLRMEDSVMQYVDTRVSNLSVGDRVEITSDGYIRPAL